MVENENFSAFSHVLLDLRVIPSTYGYIVKSSTGMFFLKMTSSLKNSEDKNTYYISVLLHMYQAVIKLVC